MAMRYTVVRDDGAERTYDVEPLDDGRLQVTCDGDVLEVDARYLANGGVHLLLDQRSCDLVVNLDDSEAAVGWQGDTRRITVLTERARRLARLDAITGADFQPDVVSPMAGKVIAVQVAPGDVVEDGDGLVIVEAMKMENVIRSTQAGRIEAVQVEAGEAVEPNQRLLVMAPLDEESDDD